MQRKASAVWRGGLKDGAGSLSTESGSLSTTPYSFTTRFENGVTGTNPEELIAAAHAGCFTMDLSNRLTEAGLKPDSIDTIAKLTIEKVSDGFSITAIDLQVTARIPNADKTAFETAVAAAKEGCPVSRLLKARISSIDATLV